MPDERPHLPDATFGQIAVDLYCYAASAHQAVVAGEVMYARGGWAQSDFPGLHATMQELQTAATIAGQLVSFFKWAARYEPELRTLIEAFIEEAARQDAA